MPGRDFLFWFIFLDQNIHEGGHRQFLILSFLKHRTVPTTGAAIAKFLNIKSETWDNPLQIVQLAMGRLVEKGLVGFDSKPFHVRLKNGHETSQQRKYYFITQMGREWLIERDVAFKEWYRLKGFDTYLDKDIPEIEIGKGKVARDAAMYQ